MVQLHRALYRLAKGKSGDWIGVETLGDVITCHEDGRIEIEEDKSSLAGAGEINSRSEALWRTLDNWTEAWIEHSLTARNALFLLVTNRQCVGPVLHGLQKKRTLENLEELLEALKGERRTVDDGRPSKLQALINKVLDRGEETLRGVLSRTMLQVEPSFFGPEQKKNTIDLLHISDLVNQELAYQFLFSWVCQELERKWDSREAGWLDVKAFNRQRDTIVEYIRLDGITARHASMIDIADAEIALAKTRNHGFLRHLARIGLQGDRLDRELIHYLRFNKEKLRLTDLGHLPQNSFKVRGEELVTRWRYIMDSEKDSPSSDNLEITGRHVLHRASAIQVPLNERPVSQLYMTVGQLHRLSDDDLVWWYPDYDPSRGD